jgi:hypothetical protein
MPHAVDKEQRRFVCLIFGDASNGFESHDFSSGVEQLVIECFRFSIVLDSCFGFSVSFPLRAGLYGWSRLNHK